MVAAYRAGTRVCDIAGEFNCASRTVRGILKNHMDPKELEEIQKENRKRFSLKSILIKTKEALEESKKQNLKPSSAKSIRCDEEKSHPASAQAPGKEYMQSSCTASNDKEQEAFLKLREDLCKRLQEFGSEAQSKREGCLGNERQTARLLVEPYLQILGIETLDPKQLQSEYSIKNGKSSERVDYALLHEDKPIWLIEVKHAGDNLPDQLPAQLNRYAVNASAPFASLTNGIDWHWYIWDDNDKSKPEETPFLKNDVRCLMNPQLDWLTTVLRGLHRPDAENKAKACKMVNLFVDWIRRLTKEPSEEMLKLVLKECDLPVTVASINLASEVLPKSFEYFIS